MTFVAQPYEQFVDDLLTAFTGGVIREEQQFLGSEESYSLASANAIPFTLKVFGQRNETFVLFEQGIDYNYDSEQAAIAWKPDGRLPDDRSFFYVNYYPQEGTRRLSDRNPGSVTTTLAEALAREFAVLHKQMEAIYRSAFVDLATGASLEHVAALLSLTRKDAKFASGEVLFKRNTPAPGDITIPSGTLVSTAQGQNFESTDKRTLRKGQLAVVVPIRAQVEGPAGKVEAGAITNINRPIFGIESVINDEATFFATAKETDEELRRRLKGTLERAGKATLDAIKYGLIEDISEITEGNIQVAERAEVPGFVEVKLGLDSTGDTDLVRRIEESIFKARPAGIRVSHNLPTRTKSESAQRAEAKSGIIPQEAVVTAFEAKEKSPTAIHLLTEILEAMPEGLLPLRVEVLVQLIEQNLSVAQKENIEDQIRTEVVEYIEKLPMGADLIYNKLLGRIVQSEKILDAVLMIGVAVEFSGANPEFYQSNLSTDGRKAKIDIYNVFVGLMEESVFIDILVQLEVKNLAEGRVELTQAVRKAVEDAINRTLIDSQDKMTQTDIRSAISTGIEAVEPRLQLIAGNAVVINAQYEETGRLLNNTDEVALEEQHVPQLRQLNIEIPGVLDG